MSDVYISQLAKCSPLIGDEYIPIVQQDKKTYTSKFTTPNILKQYLRDYMVPVGTIWLYAGIIDDVKYSPPPGWLLCDGSALAIGGLYNDLYDVIGDTYGVTNAPGVIFRLPDIRGRFVLGYSTINTVLAPNHGNYQGASITAGSAGGEYRHKLDVGELPAHNHTATINPKPPPFLHYPNSDKVLPSEGELVSGAEQQQEGNPDGSFSQLFNIEMGGMGVSYTGGDGYHNNTPPYICINHIIKY